MHPVAAVEVRPTPAPPEVALRDVEVRFAGTRVLGPISLVVPAHRTLALIGPSGSGKTTLLRLVAGLLVPAAGMVTVAGTVLAPRVLRSVRLRMGYVIQEGGLFPHLTAFDNAALVARDLGRDRAWIAARIGDLADLCHLPQTFSLATRPSCRAASGSGSRCSGR